MAAYKLLGPDGLPIKKADMLDDVASPTLTGVRSAVSGHPADGLTPARLASLHRAAAQGDPQAYLELAEDMEERDLHYAAVLSTRKRQVSQLPVNVAAVSDADEHVAHADFIREWLDTGVLDAALFDMLDAVGKGYSVQEIMWQTSQFGFVPSALTYRPQRWFGLDDATKDDPVLLEGTAKLPLPPHKFIVHRHPAKSGLMIRSGLARIASWAWMYKSYTLKDWALFVQNYGMPIRLGRYDQSTTPEEKKVLWRAIANIAGDCAALLPKSTDIEFVQIQQSRGNSSDIYERRADWFDRQISKAVLGQTTTTDAVSGGHAVAQEHRLVQEDIERADAKLVSATLNRQLIPLIISLNFGPQAKYPKLTIGRPDEVPLPVVIEALDKLGPQGLTVEASQLRDRLGFADPAEGAELVGGQLNNLFDQAADKPKAFSRVLHSRRPEPEYVDRLASRVAQDAAGALAGMTDAIREVFEEATDLHDAAVRLSKLNLSSEAMAEAMARGMALAHMTGKSALLDELDL